GDEREHRQGLDRDHHGRARDPGGGARGATRREMTTAKSRTTELPSALDVVEPLLASARRVLVSLDYDGTLTPIVVRPEIALLSQDVRHVVRELAELVPTAIVSGRDRDDVARLVAVPEAYYVGSHGFDIVGPEGSDVSLPLGEPYLPARDAVEAL